MPNAQTDVLVETLQDGTQVWVSALPEDVSVAREAKLIGGGAHGRRFATAVRQAVRDHGQWGWCTVMVTVIRNGKMGVSHLACCSYSGAEEFRRSHNYEQKRREALSQMEITADFARS